MAVFAIVAKSNPAAVKAAVTQQYGANHYEFASDVWFISDAGTTKDVADKLGITNGRISSLAVVLQITAYSGWAPAAAWTWLQQFPEVRPNG